MKTSTESLLVEAAVVQYLDGTYEDTKGQEVQKNRYQ